MSNLFFRCNLNSLQKNSFVEKEAHQTKGIFNCDE